jgi:hypothetical protein
MRLTDADLARILQQPDYCLTGSPPVSRKPTAWRSEWDFQAAVIAEAQRRAILQPEYSLLVAIPNGQYRKGQRPEAGIVAGMPDLMLCVVRVGHGALFIELKVKDGKPSQVQREMHHRLRRAGYAVAVVWDSVDEVMQVIEEYLRL